MRPVVSSIVALAIAIAPFAAMASPEKSPAHKPVAAKVLKHHKAEKTSKVDKAEKSDKVEKSDKSEKADKGEIAHGHHGKPGMKTVALHHAHNADVGGPGHKEPKIEKGALVPASLSSKGSHGGKPVISHVSHTKPAEMPPLPNPNATKASKAGNEKGAKKPSEKKNDDGNDKDGQLGRDEDFADLVARIRGKHASEPNPEKSEPKAESKGKHHEAAKPCAKAPIEIIRGPEIDTFPLTKCDGTIAPLALEHLSVLVRPGSAARPMAPVTELAKKKGAELAAGVHRVDERLALRLQALVDHFGKAGAPVKLSIVSGVRPTSVGSMHATGRAIDFRIEGTKNEDIVAFCKTLTDTGCGYYPNSSFVHLDVRDPGAGHVSWIDSSGPGETPHYVSTWPPRGGDKANQLEPVSAREPLNDEQLEQNGSESPEEHPTK